MLSSRPRPRFSRWRSLIAGGSRLPSGSRMKEEIVLSKSRRRRRRMRREGGRRGCWARLRRRQTFLPSERKRRRSDATKGDPVDGERCQGQVLTFRSERGRRLRKESEGGSRNVSSSSPGPLWLVLSSHRHPPVWSNLGRVDNRIFSPFAAMGNIKSILSAPDQVRSSPSPPFLLSFPSRAGFPDFSHLPFRRE